MRTRSVITAALAAAVFLVAPRAVAAQDKGDELTMKLASIEESLWVGWQNDDPAPFENNLVDGAVSIGPWGISSKAETMADVANGNCDVAGFTLSDWKARKVGEGTAVLTYKATQEAMCDGEAVPTNIVVSSTYVMHGGYWMSASYQETPVDSD